MPRHTPAPLSPLSRRATQATCVLLPSPSPPQTHTRCVPRRPDWWRRLATPARPRILPTRTRGEGSAVGVWQGGGAPRRQPPGWPPPAPSLFTTNTTSMQCLRWRGRRHAGQGRDARRAPSFFAHPNSPVPPHSLFFRCPPPRPPSCWRCWLSLPRLATCSRVSVWVWRRERGTETQARRSHQSRHARAASPHAPARRLAPSTAPHTPHQALTI